MGYSRDPMNYDVEERALMLAALGESVSLEFETEKEAYNQRGRLYGLRKAAQIAYDKLMTLEKQGKATTGYDYEFIRAAPALRAVGVRFGNLEKTTLIMGKGEALTPKRRGVLQRAAKKYNIVSEELRTEREMMARLGQLGEAGELKTTAEVDRTFDDLGYGTEELIGNKDGKRALKVEVTDISNETLQGKIERGEALTPEEMKRSQELKHHE